MYVLFAQKQQHVLSTTAMRHAQQQVESIEWKKMMDADKERVDTAASGNSFLHRAVNSILRRLGTVGFVICLVWPKTIHLKYAL